MVHDGQKIAGGKSYSPDFAYVIDYNDGKKKLNFIIETKNYERINQISRIQVLNATFSSFVNTLFNCSKGDK